MKSVFVFIILLCLSSGATAKARPFNMGVIKVGEPLGYFSAQDKPIGIYTEISQAFLRELNIRSQISLLPVQRLTNSLQSGNVDCAILYTSETRKRNFLQISPIVKRPTIIVLGEHLSINKQGTLSQFEGKLIGSIRQNDRTNSFYSNHKIRKHWIANYEQGLNMLRLNRLDGFYGAKDIIDELYDTKGNFYVFTIDESWLQCSKASDLVKEIGVEKLKIAMQTLRGTDSGSDIVYQIHKKYFKNYQLFTSATHLSSPAKTDNNSDE